jgi:hypothetical protein
MNQSTARPTYYRLTLVCMLVLCALLASCVRPLGALAANVSNPEPKLIERWEPCEPNTGVTVIVDERKIGTGKVYVGCALGEQANGVQALQNAGFHIEGTKEYGLAFICRIEGEPTLAEQSCEHSAPANAYWSYWHGKPGGRWSYSGVGAYAYKPALGSVEGWGFAGGPRIEPMDGSGPSSFVLPPEQESSVIPARLAREWLTPTLNETAVRTEADELHKGEELFLPTLLRGVVALTQAGVQPAKLASIAHWLSRTCEEGGVSIGSCALRGFAEPKAPEHQSPNKYAVAILALQALGENPSLFDGEDLRGKLEGMIEETTGKVDVEGTPSEGVRPLALTVLALARTGALPEKALKTIKLLLAKQEHGTGSFEEETNINVEAIEALVAAREKGAAVVGGPLMQEIEAALTKAGENLKHLQDRDGSVRSRGHYKETEPEPEPKEAEPTIESTALGAIGLALTGHNPEAVNAAKWLSRYQITAEYAGKGDPETGEHTPAEALIGAFAEDEGALKEALAHGIHPSELSIEHYGVYGEAQAPTVYALAALTIAGPYGPYETTQIPLTGTGTPGPKPQPKTESGPGPLVGPPSPTPSHNTSGPVAHVAVERISPARLLLKFTGPGVATVKIARLRGKGRHRRWQTIKTIVVKAGKAGALGVELGRLAPGSYRVSIGLVGAKTVVRTLTVPSRRR